MKSELERVQDIEQKINEYLSEHTDQIEVRCFLHGEIAFVDMTNMESAIIHYLHLKNIVEIVEGREPVDYRGRF
jgi:hypothetical protein